MASFSRQSRSRKTERFAAMSGSTSNARYNVPGAFSNATSKAARPRAADKAERFKLRRAASADVISTIVTPSSDFDIDRAEFSRSSATMLAAASRFSVHEMAPEVNGRILHDFWESAPGTSMNKPTASFDHTTSRFQSKTGKGTVLEMHNNDKRYELTTAFSDEMSRSNSMPSTSFRQSATGVSRNRDHGWLTSRSVSSNLSNATSATLRTIPDEYGDSNAASAERGGAFYAATSSSRPLASAMARKPRFADIPPTLHETGTDLDAAFGDGLARGTRPSAGFAARTERFSRRTQSMDVVSSSSSVARNTSYDFP